MHRKMRPIAAVVARSVVCVCVLGTLMGPAKTYEPIEMPLGRSRLATAEGIIRSGAHCDLLLNFLRYLIQKGFITYDFLLVFRI